MQSVDPSAHEKKKKCFAQITSHQTIRKQQEEEKTAGGNLDAADPVLRLVAKSVVLTRIEEGKSIKIWMHALFLHAELLSAVRVTFARGGYFLDCGTKIQTRQMVGCTKCPSQICVWQIYHVHLEYCLS